MKLAENSICSGCTACYSICPRRAISMKANHEGFLYPVVDKLLCVECGLCARVCPSLHPSQSREPIVVYAAKANNDALRMSSSSGGMFSIVAKAILDKGGVVFGAAFAHKDWHVYHRWIEHAEEMFELRGSKYVQSEIGDCYHQVEGFLKSGRLVLFTGTPCQIAGLKHYLALRPDVSLNNLLTVDVVCHAAPSPLAWRKYLETRVNSVCNTCKRSEGKISGVAFRRKDCGWKKFSLVLSFANGVKYRKVFCEDAFMHGFLTELFNRTSCSNCMCRSLRSGSDLTIADYWNVHELFPWLDDDKGISLVLVNTKNGDVALKEVSHECMVYESTYDHACATNPPIIVSRNAHSRREEFFLKVNEQGFDSLVDKLLRPPLMRRMRTYVGLLFRTVGFRK